MEELTGPMEQVLKEFKKMWRDYNEQEPFWHVLQGFFHAIDWKEPWIVGLLVFHVALFIAILALRRRSNIIFGIFFLIGCVVYNSERLNALGAARWKAFAGQPYFDPRGVFFSAVVSGPLLFNMLTILICYLIETGRMLVKTKRREIMYKARQRAKEAQAEGSNEGKKEQ